MIKEFRAYLEHLFSLMIETRMHIKGLTPPPYWFLLPLNTKELVSLF